MTFDEVLQESSNLQKILDYIDDLEEEYPSMLYGNREMYTQYNKDVVYVLDKIRSFIENL